MRRRNFIHASLSLVISAAIFVGSSDVRAAQQQYDSGNPTAAEQYVLEIINRARSNPTAEGTRLNININEGMSQNAVVRPPLAMNKILLGTARAHSQDMYTRKFFEHTNPDGKDPFERIDGAGYNGNAEGENIAASSNGSALNLEDILMRDTNYPGRGHRVNLLGVGNIPGMFREIGVGYYSGATPITGSSQQGVNGLKDFITQDFGSNSTGPFIVGVVYNDANNNNFYDIGEGLSGVTIAPDSGNFLAVTGTAGGYAIPVGTSGTVTLTASGGGLASPMQMQVTLTGSNVKVDFVAGKTPVIPPSITSSLTASGTVSKPFSYTVTASGDATITYMATGLPAGLTLSGATISGTPQVAGQFMIVLKATNSGGSDIETLVLTVAPPVSNTGTDTDSDGFPDELETALSTAPNNSADTPFGGAPAGAPQVMTPDKLQINLNFAKPNLDKLTFGGTLAVPSGFVALNKVVTIDVGGVIQSFTLDAKGKAVLPPIGSTFKLTFKTAKGAVPAQNAKFTATISKISFSSKLADEGLLNATITKAPVTIPAIVLFNGVKFEQVFALLYTSKITKTGATKVPPKK